ncbi:hypothetical protein ACLI07_15420 [Providencia huaxiensis]|uniref:hypothetical protein n=1 Tax=Providencia TaxID=586 RepID=UPI0023497D14|nr:hypothetical protein [Providencia sp. PROV076]
MTRVTLSLRKNNNGVTNPPATNTPKNIQAKTSQEAPQQPKKKNKARCSREEETTPYRPYSEALDAI